MSDNIQNIKSELPVFKASDHQKTAKSGSVERRRVIDKNKKKKKIKRSTRKSDPGHSVKNLLDHVSQVNGANDALKEMLEESKCEIDALTNASVLVTSSGDSAPEPVPHIRDVTSYGSFNSTEDLNAAWQNYENEVQGIYIACLSVGDDLSKIRKKIVSHNSWWLSRLNLKDTPEWPRRMEELWRRLELEHLGTITWTHRFKLWWNSNLLRFKIYTGCGLLVLIVVILWLSPLVLLLILIVGLLLRMLRSPQTVSYYQLKTITDSCCSNDNLPPIHQSATITMPTMATCVPKNYQVLFCISNAQPWIARPCVHSERTALVCRQLLPALSTAEVRSSMWRKASERFYRQMTFAPWRDPSPEDVQDFLKRYPGGRRRVLEKQINEANWEYINSNTKAFVKVEWLVPKAHADRYPRLISGKHDEYLCETFPYWLWQKDNLARFRSGKFIYTSGMSGAEIGAIFTEYVNNGWHVYEGDFSKFDGRQEKECLEAEISLYAATGCPPRLCDALRKQLKCRGNTRGGIRFSCSGKKASGVINTGFGNTLINFMLACAIIQVEFVIMALGDDNIVFTRELLDVLRVIDLARQMGHKLEMIHRPDPEFAEYCSNRFWNCGDQYVLGPKPGRVIVKTFMTRETKLSEGDLLLRAQQIAYGFREYSWVPVLGKLCQNVAQNIRCGQATDSEYQISCGNLDFAPDNAFLEAQFVKVYGQDLEILEEIVSSDVFRKVGICIVEPALFMLARIDGATSHASFIDVEFDNVA